MDNVNEKSQQRIRNQLVLRDCSVFSFICVAPNQQSQQGAAYRLYNIRENTPTVGWSPLSSTDSGKEKLYFNRKWPPKEADSGWGSQKCNITVE